MLFSFFQPIEYKGKLVTDILRNYRAYFNAIIGDYNINTYYIQGSPRPEQVAYELYGNPQLYWLLFMLNDVYDPFYDWITDQESAYQAAEQRYKGLGGNQVLYHVDEHGEKYWNLVEYPVGSGNWYDKGDEHHRHLQFQGALAAVDIYEDAILQNEKRRKIKVLDPSQVKHFINAFVRQMEAADVHV